jgi:hypothetical protein
MWVRRALQRAEPQAHQGSKRALRKPRVRRRFVWRFSYPIVTCRLSHDGEGVLRCAVYSELSLHLLLLFLVL